MPIENNCKTRKLSGVKVAKFKMTRDSINKQTDKQSQSINVKPNSGTVRFMV